MTLTFHPWPWIKVIALPWVQCNNSVKYYSNPCFHWKCMARTIFKPLWAQWLEPITLNQGHVTFLVPGQQYCKMLFKFKKRFRSYGLDNLFAYVLTIMFTVTLTFDQWPWIKVMTPIASSVTILWNIIPIHVFGENVWPGQCLNHYEQWTWPLTNNLESMSCHFLCSWATIL
jgi:hypothetical protein